MLSIIFNWLLNSSTQCSVIQLCLRGNYLLYCLGLPYSPILCFLWFIWCRLSSIYLRFIQPIHQRNPDRGFVCAGASGYLLCFRAIRVVCIIYSSFVICLPFVISFVALGIWFISDLAVLWGIKWVYKLSSSSVVVTHWK